MNVVKVTIEEDGITHTPVHLINGDEMYITNSDKPYYVIGKYIAMKMKMKLKHLEAINKTLHKRLQERDTQSLQAATVDELLNELKLRSEYFT